MGFFGGGGSGGGYPPVTSSTGAVQVGFSGGDTLGTNAINVQPSRSATNQVAANPNSIVIGTNTRAYDSTDIGSQVVIGSGASARYRNGVALGSSTYAHESAIAIGASKNARETGSVAINGGIKESGSGGVDSTAIGGNCQANADRAVAMGGLNQANHDRSVVIGGFQLTTSFRAEFVTAPIRAAYWSGQTTNATPTILNLDGTATNRFTIAANTAVMADIYIIARRTDTVDKWFSSRRMVAIRRNNANGTAIIGSVQTIGADQTEGSPTWSVAITADDTNEALQVEVTGAASETVEWRISAIYRVV
jgi:hypothetical protein